jgi:hypothetical protein
MTARWRSLPQDAASWRAAFDYATPPQTMQSAPSKAAAKAELQLSDLVVARPQSSKWLTMPSASFGSNQVDFGGMIAPASATAMRSLICVG